MALSGAKPVKLYIWDDTAKDFVKWDGALNVSSLEIGAVEIKDHDGTDRLEITSDKAAVTTEKEVAPTSAKKNNPSYVLTYTSDELTGIAMTIGTTVYNRTLTWTSNNLTAMSVWTEA